MVIDRLSFDYPFRFVVVILIPACMRAQPDRVACRFYPNHSLSYNMQKSKTPATFCTHPARQGQGAENGPAQQAAHP